MEVIKFLEEWKRMCNSYDCSCDECPSYMLCHANTPFGEMNNLQEIVDHIEKWSAEHPVKTRLQHFLEKYPNAPLKPNGYPLVLPNILGYCNHNSCGGCSHVNIACWDLPSEE